MTESGEGARDEVAVPRGRAVRGIARAGYDQRAQTRYKGTQIWPDQWNELDVLVRELQDARSVKDERITANTLIRVALDGLITHQERLHGDNEVELRTSWLTFLAARPPGQDPR